MRILLLAQFYPPDIGGEERHVRNLAIALADRGHEPQVLTTALPQTGAGDFVEDGIPVRRVKTSAQRLPIYQDAHRPHATPIADPGMSRAIDRLLSEGDFDVVHAHNWIVNSALAPARRRHVPVVLTLHDYSHVCAIKRFVRAGAECSGPQFEKCLGCSAGHYGRAMGTTMYVANEWERRRRERNLAHFITVSSAVAQYNGLSSSPVPYEVIPNFIPDTLIEPAPPTPDGPITFVGDLTTQKGTLVLREAYRGLEDPPELVFAGRPIPGVEVEPDPRIRLTGPLGHEEVMSLMAAARFVVVPSIMPDPCPTVVLEAMARGRAVIASRNGGIVDMVEDGVTGILVPPGAVEPLAAAIRELNMDPARCEEMGRAGAERARRFTASHVAERVERVYQRVLRPMGLGASVRGTLTAEEAV